ncbi:MAG: I78 family peptidase inhibitor [Phenylobacterium sp.]|nr:I78 family peptidase inhibitor [Phenylobacterium sp.]
MTWVFKPDGAIQCQGGPAQSLDSARAELARLIGESEILRGVQAQLIVMTVCGAPGGRVNAFELTPAGLERLQTGFVGPGGWRLWIFDDPPQPAASHGSKTPAGPEVPLPLSATLDRLLGDAPMPKLDFLPSETLDQMRAWQASLASRAMEVVLQFAAAQPTRLDELVGYDIRLVKPGEGVTRDLRPDRLNLYLDEHGRIRSHAFH